MLVVTSEGLVRVDDRESRSASGDCEGDSNKYEDFFHGLILSKRQFEPYHTSAGICDRNRRKLRTTLCEKESEDGTPNIDHQALDGLKSKLEKGARWKKVRFVALNAPFKRRSPASQV